MEIRTLRDIPELKGKKVLLRVDFNVPLTDNEDVQDDTRMVEALPTIKYLQEKEAKIILVSHLGRPDGQVKENLRLNKIASYLGKLLDQKIEKTDTIIGEDAKIAVDKMEDGQIVMLENVRFDAGEEACSDNFCHELASLAEIYVNDAFGTAHRKHASTAGVADYLPAYAGFLMEKEIKALSKALSEDIERPLTMIFGGAKIDTKIDVIRNFVKRADYVLLGGGLANTFLYAAGYNVGTSLYEEHKADLARDIMMEFEKEKAKFILPHDVVVTDEIKEDAETMNVPIEDVMGEMKILDIGKWTAEKFCNIINESGTVIWNGPLGLSEMTPFSMGSKAIAECMAKSNCYSIIGGGDTVDALKRFNIPPETFNHISTGGGACIEFLEGKTLPGIMPLLHNQSQ